MAEDERKVTSEEIASWYTPRQAVEYAIGVVGNYPSARDAIWTRVTAGLIESASDYRTVEEPGKAAIGRTEPRIIPISMWTRYSEPNSDFWSAGDATFFLSRNTFEKTTIRFLGIRLNPSQLHATIPAPRKGDAAKATEAAQPEPEQKGPRVTEPHLKAWFAFYKALHSSTEDTEDRALEHARQCFPGKSVSRDRIRNLRGAVKRGPKPKPT